MHRTKVSIALAVAALGAAAAAPAAQAGTLKIGGSTGAGLLFQNVAKAFNKQFGSKGVTAGQYALVGSGAGIAGANAGTYDVGGSSRDPRSSDAKGLVFTPLSKESLVVAVHPKNPICKKGLTSQQVKDIFTGVATDWGQVGGTPGTIRVLSRVSTSGTQASFEKVYLDGVKAKGQPLFSNGAIRSQVTRDRNAVGGVTGAYMEGYTRACGVKIDGVAPTLKNTASGRFKYWTYQYAVTKGEPTGEAKQFIDFARSKAVQTKIISKFAVPLPAGVTPVAT